MTEEHYKIVEHDGGWAYKVEDVYSETFPSHAAALEAAKLAAQRQRTTGEPSGISYQDEKGQWHDEVAPGDDRPTTDVLDT